MASEKKQSVLNGAMMLMAAVVLVKLIGVLFKIPLSDMLGATGRGYFNSAYEVYTPVFAISMAGLPVAVSRMVAEYVAVHKYNDARAVFKTSQRLFVIVGLAGTAVLLAAAYPYTHFVAGEKSFLAVLCVAPSIFFCCYMSAYRGYYEGLRNMTPTAVSQVIEALGKLLVGIALVKIVITIGNSQYDAGMLENAGAFATVFGQKVISETDANSVILPVAAAGAVLGVTIGSVASNLFLIIVHKVKGDGFDRVQLVNSPPATSSRELASTMIKIAVPMVVSSLVLNITNLVDTATIQSRLIQALQSDFDTVWQMHAQSFEKAVELSRIDKSDIESVKSYLWGSYGMALDFRNLVPTITIQLGVSALPALAAAWTVKDKASVKSTIETVVRISMLVALPAGIGMAVLASPILTIIYGRGSSSEAIDVVSPILFSYGIATPLMAISTPTTNMLQAIGRTDIPVKSVVVGAICKIICNFILVGNPKINIYGAVVGTILFYVVIVLFNFISLLRISKVKVRWLSIFGKPFICALLCGVTAFASNRILSTLLPQWLSFIPSDTTESVLNTGTVSAVIAIGLAAIVYLVSLLLIKGIAREDVSVLPKGEKIAKTLEKYKLLG